VWAWVYFFTRGSHPHPTRTKPGSGANFIWDPRVTRRAPVNSPNFISAQLINELLEAIAHLHTTGIYSLSNPSTPSQSRTHSRNTPLLLLVFQPAGDSGSTAEDGLRWHAGAQSVVLLLHAATHPYSCSPARPTLNSSTGDGRGSPAPPTPNSRSGTSSTPPLLPQTLTAVGTCASVV
jgi:hypothetical protein